MNKYLFLIFLMILSVDAMGYSVDGTIGPFYDTGAEVFDDDGKIVLRNNGIINGNIIIDTADSVYLYNHGTINGVIDINDNNLFVYNSGTMNYQIVNNGTFGNVTQIITPDTGIHFVNVSDGIFSVRIENMGENSLNFSDIKNINATSFNISDSWIVINDFSDWQNWNKQVNTSGTIHLIITDENVVNYDGVIVNNVSGNVALDVQMPQLDGSQRLDKERFGEQFRLKIVSETNYNVINDGENSALEEIRDLNPGDKLLEELSLAKNTMEIERIKNNSYRFNHGILLRPIRVINNFAMMVTTNDKTDFGLGFKPVYVVSDKISNIGGRVYLGHYYNDFYFNVGLNLNRFEYADDINEFSGFMYGTDIQMKQYFNKLWINGLLGFNLTDFKANYISSDNTIKKNPYGISWYSELDTGYDFDLGNDFILTPIVGFSFQNYTVADVSDNEFYVRGGAGLKYSFVTDGIKYEYGAEGSVASNGNLYSAAKVGFWSVTDEAGVALSAGMLKDDIDYNYQFSLSAKMLF